MTDDIDGKEIGNVIWIDEARIKDQLTSHKQPILV